MFAFRPTTHEQVAGPKPERSTHPFGAVRCPKCTERIEIVGLGLALAEEFSVRCTACQSRSFHTRSAISAAVLSKTNG